MKRKIEESIIIPEGVTCSLEENKLTCSANGKESSRVFILEDTDLKIDGNNLSIVCEKGNKKSLNKIKTAKAHILNLFHGVKNGFSYELESANVHFPMTLKVDGDKLVITNFLGEKQPRHAKILPDVEVEVKGNKITISSHDLESAGQTAANFEEATKVKGRDRRIFQDGIYIVSKPIKEAQDAN